MTVSPLRTAFPRALSASGALFPARLACLPSRFAVIRIERGFSLSESKQ